MTNDAEFIAEAFVRTINHQAPGAIAELMSEDHRFVDSFGNCAQGREM